MATNARRNSSGSSELLNKLASEMKALSETVEELKNASTGVPENLTEQLQTYQTQLGDLNERMSVLQRSTVGTKEYEAAMA